MTWDKALTIVRLIDKTQSTPLGVTEGGLIDGDLNNTNFFARLVKERGDGKSPTSTLFLYPPVDGKFTRTAPILIDKAAPDKYLLEVQISARGVLGDRQRYRISTPTLTEDDDLGEVLSIPCESLAHQALHESLISIQDELVTPKQRVINILTAWNGEPGDDKVFLTFDSLSDIDLPDNEALKFDYTSSSPKTVSQLLRDVLDRIKEAGPLGGVFKNFYYTTEADPLLTRGVQIKFEEFGKTNSGVIISNTNNIGGIPKNKALMTSNKKRKKKIVVKYDQRSASLPMEHAEFASSFLHAKNRPEWSSSATYLEGDVVKFTHVSFSPRIIRFFKMSSSTVGPTINNPDVDNSNWDEDFTIIPPWNADAFYTIGEIVARNETGTIRHYRCDTQTGPDVVFPSGDFSNILIDRPSSTYANFFSPSPWTADLQNFKANLVGTASPPAGYIGYTVDWNYERILNDIPDFTNRFQYVTGKSVRETVNNPPVGLDRKLYAGYRVLVGTSAINGFAGQDNRIAQWAEDTLRGIVGHWEFSNAPVEGDTITHLGKSAIKAFESGNWVDKWTIANSDKPTPFHIVKSMQLVRGASGIPGQAVELRFDWKDALNGGSDHNRTSRGASACFFYPAPIEDTASTNLGGTYGGGGTIAPTQPYINHINLTRNSNGIIGWNNSNSKDLGRLPSHSFKIRLGMFRSSSDDSIKSKGKGNIPMTYWRKDHEGRFFFKDFTIPENNQWHPVTVALPPFGPSNLYFNRLDELATVLGYTIPFDFFIPEKEFTGVKYEFRKKSVLGGLHEGHVQQYRNVSGQLSQLHRPVCRGCNAAVPRHTGICRQSCKRHSYYQCVYIRINHDRSHKACN